MDLVRDQGPKGGIGHDMSDGTDPWKRQARYGQSGGGGGESVSYGQDTPLKVAIQLVVDKGVVGKGHRKNFYSPESGAVGIATGPHAKYGTMTCVDYTRNFKELNGSLTSL